MTRVAQSQPRAQRWQAGPSARFFRMVVAASLIGLGLVVAEPTSTPAEAAGCQSSQIAVVVSFNSLGGGTQTSCVGDVGSGLAALSEGGFSYSFVPNQPGLVCQINGAPSPCNGAPTNAYWSYWVGSMGGSWSYSNLGAGNRNPAPGSAEGWSFGAGGEPAIGPPAAIAPPPPPPPPPPPAPAPAPAPPPGGGSGGGGSGGGTESGSSPAPGSSGSSDSPTDSGSSQPGDAGSVPGASDSSNASVGRGRGGGDSGAAQGQADALPPAADSSAGGTPWPVLATIAGLAALGGAAYWQQRRRRSGPPAAEA